MKLTKKLAARLHGTTKNVYQLCGQMFKGAKADETFEQLESEACLFRCENCNQLDTDAMAPDFAAICEECASDQNAMDDE